MCKDPNDKNAAMQELAVILGAVFTVCALMSIFISVVVVANNIRDRIIGIGGEIVTDPIHLAMLKTDWATFGYGAAIVTAAFGVIVIVIARWAHARSKEIGQYRIGFLALLLIGIVFLGSGVAHGFFLYTSDRPQINRALHQAGDIAASADVKPLYTAGGIADATKVEFKAVLILPAGTYTALVFTATGALEGAGGISPNPARAVIKTDGGEFPLHLAAGTSISVSFGDGWTLDHDGEIRLYKGDGIFGAAPSAWAITPGGPVKLRSR